MYRASCITTLLAVLVVLAGCSGATGSLSPGLNSDTSPQITSSGSTAANPHGITGCVEFGQVVINSKTGTVEIIYPRTPDLSLNVLEFLEPPAFHYLDIDFYTLYIDPFYGRVEVDVILRHPWQLPFFRGFDVRCIIFGPDVLNADGYTTLLNPDDFTDVPYGYQDGLFGTPDEIAQFDNPGDLWGYKYFCDGLLQNQDLGQFFSDPANLQKRGTFSPGIQNRRHYVLQFSEEPDDFLVFNYAVLASFNAPKGEKPWGIEDFPITTANAAEPFVCQMDVLHNLLYYIDTDLHGGTAAIDLYIGDWQGFSDFDVEIQFADASNTTLSPSSYEPSGLPHIKLFHFPEFTLDLEQSGDMPILITATDNTTTFGKSWFQGLLPDDNPRYNDSVYTCWRSTIPISADIPFNPVDVTPEYLEPLHPDDIFVKDNIVYVASTRSGFSVIDFSNPVSPVLLARLKSTETLSTALSVGGDIAYLAAEDKRLQLVIIADPSNPVLAGSCDVKGDPRDVEIQGNYAYVAGGQVFGSGKLNIVEISNPLSPSLTGVITVPWPAYNVEVNGDYAYINSQNFYVIDISNPAEPYVTGKINSLACTGLDYANGFVYGTESSQRFYIVDVTDPSQPVVRSGLDFIPPNYTFLDIMVSGEYAYVPRSSQGGNYDKDNGLWVFDVSDPDDPFLAHEYGPPDSCDNVFITQDRIFLAEQFSGIYCLDMQSPTDLTLAGTYLPPGWAFDAVFIDNSLIVANWLTGLISMDCGSPTSPELIGFYDTYGLAMNLETAQKNAYTSGYFAGMQMIDYSNVEQPQFLGSYPDDSSAMHVGSVSADGNYVYISGVYPYDSWGILDVSDPAAPVFFGPYDEKETAGRLCLDGNLLCVTNIDNDMLIYNVTEPDAPSLLGVYQPQNPDSRVNAVAGGKAYLYCLDVGMEIADVSDPANPACLGSYEPGYWGILTIKYGYAFMGCEGFIDVIDVSNPTNPLFVLKINMPENDDSWGGHNTLRFHSSGNIAYAIDGINGVRILQLW